MRINIESVRKRDAANSIKFDYEAMAGDMEDAEKNKYIALLDAEAIDFIKITGEISQKNGLPAIDYAIKARFSAAYARCLKETWQTIGAEGEKYIADKSEDKDNGGDFYVAETDGILDVPDFIAEFLGVETPYRYLCSEDCKGLCHKCGKDLNAGGCDCPKKEKNPAFEILDGFFDELAKE